MKYATNMETEELLTWKRKNEIHENPIKDFYEIHSLILSILI